MKKITFLLFILSLTLKAQMAFQGFEGTAADDWNYSLNVPAYNNNSDTDLWTTYTSSIGTLGGPYAGSTYWVGRDLDNPYSEGVTGDTTPDHYMDFDAVNIGGVAADLSIFFEFEGYDSSDFIFYELAYDNGTDWSSPDVHVDVNPKPSPSNSTSVGNTWQEFTTAIPPGNTYVRLRIGAHQNGTSDYLAIDNVKLTSSGILGVSNTTIAGFSYGPNPVTENLHVSASTVIEEVIIYNLVGQQVLSRTGDSNQMTLGLGSLEQGVYSVKVVSEGNIQTIRVVKK